MNILVIGKSPDTLEKVLAGLRAKEIAALGTTETERASIDFNAKDLALVAFGGGSVFSGGDRRRYVQGLVQVIERGGRLFLMCGSAEESRDIIPRVSRQELYDAFAGGWEVESVRPVRYELNP